jgi:1,4-alpha-glucan branching enzyme
MIGKAKQKSGQAKSVSVQLQVSAPPDSEVFVAGSFNNWEPAAHKMRQNGNGTFVTRLKLAPGRYEYKFLVNGQWQLDESAPEKVQNSYGSMNSVMDLSASGAGTGA